MLHGGLWSAASQLLPSVGVAVLSVVAARLLGTDALGRQSLIAYVNSATAATFVTGLGSAGLQVLGRLQGAGDDRYDALGAWLVRMHAVTGVVLCAAMAGIGLALRQDRLAWVIVGLVTVVDSIISGICVRVAVRQGWVQVGKLQLYAQLAGAPLGIGALALGFGIPGIFGGDGVAAIVLLGVLTARFAFTFPSTPHRWRLRPPVPMAKAWAQFSGSNLLYQVVGRRVEFLALAVSSTDQQIATYSVAFMLISLMAAVPGSVASAALPVIAAAEGRGDSATATRHMREAVRVGTLLSLPLVATAAALGPTLVELVYGHAYDDAAHLVPLASLVLLVAVAGGVMSQYWSGRGDVRITLITGGIAGVADLSLAFALVPSLGARGAIIANLVGQIVSVGGLLTVTVRRTGGVGWPWRSLLRMAAVCAAAGAVAWLEAGAVSRHATGPHVVVDLVALLVGFTAGAGVGTLGAVFVKVLGPQETAWLSGLLPDRLGPVLAAVTSR